MLLELSAQGKTVFVSSHLMSEIAQTATRLIVIGKGRLIANTSVAEFTAGHASLEDAFVDLTKDAVEYRAASRSTFEEQK
jgi:ABC-2 type transport system ATP-binding protein